MNFEQAALATLRHVARQRIDPLATFRPVPKQLEYVHAVADNTESALRAANKFGKSTIVAFIVVAFLRGMRQFCGVELPRFRQPARGWVLTRTYKQQVEGTQAAVILALGDWPHEIAWEDRNKGIWSGVWVRPEGWKNDNPQTWAWLAFVSQHNSLDADIAKGARLDFVWFDEPGYESVMRELRKAGRPGYPFRIIHDFTPIYRNEWESIRADIERRDSHIREVVAEVYDAERGRVENGFLSSAEIAELEKLYEGDEHKDARLHAIYCDTRGSCPFNKPAIMALWKDATPGVPHVAWETSAGFVLRPHDQGEVRVWGEAGPRDRVLVCANPSAGVKPADGEKGSHLANVQAISIGQRKQLLEWVGYLTPPELALLCRAITNRYREWIFVPEMNGGWGEELLRSFQATEPANGSDGVIYQDVDPTSTIGNAKTRVGWWQTANRRNAGISALQRALLEGSLGIFSRYALESLMLVARDRLGRYDDPENGTHPRYHIVLGMACSIMENGNLVLADKPPDELTAREAFERSMGVTLPDSTDGSLYREERTPWR